MTIPLACILYNFIHPGHIIIIMFFYHYDLDAIWSEHLFFSECLLQSLVSLSLWTAVSVVCWAKKRRSEWFHLVCHPMKSDRNWHWLHNSEHNVLDEMYDRINIYIWITINCNRKVLSETRGHEDGRMFPLSTRQTKYY